MAGDDFSSYFQKLEKVYGGKEAPQQPQQGQQTSPQDQSGGEFESYFKRLEEQKIAEQQPQDTRTTGEIVRHAPQPDKPLEWSEVGKQAIQNIPQSAKAYGESLLTPFTQPKETLEAIGQIGKGAYSKVAGALGAEQNAEKKAQDEAAVNAIGKFYADRYGSVEGFKNALANDPVGVLADAASVFTLGGGAASKAPGLIGQAGKAASAVGSAVDPLMIAGQGVKGATRAATAALSLPEWWTTGASLSSLNTAAKAGLENNKTFISHLTGSARPEEAVRRIEDVHSAIAKKRSNEFVQSLGPIAQTPLSYQPVGQAISDAYNRMSRAGTPIYQNGVAALDDVTKKVNEFMANKNIVPNIESFQDLKVAIRDIAQKYPLGQAERSAVDSVANAIRDQMASLPNGVGKKYMDAMETYADQSRQLSEIRQGFLSGRSDANKIRKILSTKDNKYKSNMLEEIAKYDPEIPYIVAGMELQPLMPSGLRGQIAGVVSGAGAFMAGVPQAIGGMLVHSPRAMGATQYGLGQIGGAAPRMMEAAPMLRQVPFQAGRATEELEREQRATGGKVTGSIAQRLVAAADKAHKYHQKATEEILDTPDEHVVKALAVANKHI